MRLSLFLVVGLGSCLAALAGCTAVEPNNEWHGAGQKNLCLVDNPSVRPQAFLSLRRALMDKGLKVTRVEADDTLRSHLRLFLEYVDFALRKA